MKKEKNIARQSSRQDFYEIGNQQEKRLRSFCKLIYTACSYLYKYCFSFPRKVHSSSWIVHRIAEK
jgi:hypothetical protein